MPQATVAATVWVPGQTAVMADNVNVDRMLAALAVTAVNQDTGVFTRLLRTEISDAFVSKSFNILGNTSM